MGIVMRVLLRLTILVSTYCVSCTLNLNFVKPEFVRFSLYIKIEGIITVCAGCTYTLSGIWMKVYK